MLSSLPSLFGVLLKAGAIAFVANEVRGLMLAVPILYGIYQAGGTVTAIWLGLSSIGGVLLSVIVPVFAARKLKKLLAKRQPVEVAIA